jgi:hypothetical protein
MLKRQKSFSKTFQFLDKEENTPFFYLDIHQAQNGKLKISVTPNLPPTKLFVPCYRHIANESNESVFQDPPLS